MAPRKRTAQQTEMLTHIVYMLVAIRTHDGDLTDIIAQRTLTEKVIRRRELGVSADTLRTRIFGAVNKHPAKPNITRGADIFTKKPSKVFNAEYFTQINEVRHAIFPATPDVPDPKKAEEKKSLEDDFKESAGEVPVSEGLETNGIDAPRRAPPRGTKQVEEKRPAGSTKLKLLNTRKATPAAGNSDSPQSSHDQDHASSITGAGQANDTTQPGDGSSAGASSPIGDTPTEQDVSRQDLNSPPLDNDQAGASMMVKMAEATNDVTDPSLVAAADIMPERHLQQTAEPGEESTESPQLAVDYPSVGFTLGGQRSETVDQLDQTLQKRPSDAEAERLTPNDLHERSKETQQSTQQHLQDVNAARRTNDDLREAHPKESQQHALRPAEETEALKEQIEQIEAARLVNDHLLEAKHKETQEALEREIDCLKKQLEQARGRNLTSPGKKRALQDRNDPSEEPAAKRQQTGHSRFHQGIRSKVNKDMHEISGELEQFALRYFRDRDLSLDDWADLVKHPDKDLEQLYTQIFTTEQRHSWQQAQVEIQFRGWETFKRLVAADVLRTVFLGELPWTGETTIASSLAYLEAKEEDEVDHLVRLNATRRLTDQQFLEVEIPHHARHLAHLLNITLSPHLTRLGRPKMKSSEWFDELVGIYRKALIVKATVDTYEGSLQVFWPSIGRQMDPCTASSGMHPDRAQTICAVEWPGLRLKLKGGEPDLVLSRARVATIWVDVS